MAHRTDPYDKSIVIDGWEQGIADSPFQGISDMRNVNIVPIPGEASVEFSTVSATLASSSGNVASADSNTEIITLSGVTTALATGMTFVFTGASLPGGISAATPYLIKVLSPTTIKIFASYADFVNNSPVNISSTGTGTFVTVDMGKPTHRAKSATNIFALDANGRAWIDDGTASAFVYLLNSTLTNASGNGLMVYLGYLFVFRNALIDYMNLTTTAWTYGWQTMNTGASLPNSHYAHYGQDNVIYYCDGAFIGSFFQKAGQTFDPSNAATYTFAQQALALPSNDIAQCLAELGTNLLVGGQLNAIYPWNRIATSFTYPILLAESFIWRMVTVNTNTYILAGQRGRIYKTNGSQASLYKKVPDHISGTTEPYYFWGDAAFDKNQLFFGITAKTNDSLTAINQYGGVWAIDLDSRAIRLINKLSYGTYAGLATTLITNPVTTTGNPPIPSLGAGNNLIIGWDSGASTYGIDVGSSTVYTNSQATIDSDLIPIGTFDKPRDFTRVEYRLTKPMVSGESISIYYRLDFSQNYTLISTDTATSTYLPFSKSFPVNFKNAQWVQFQVVLNSVSNNPSYVRLKEIRITGVQGTPVTLPQQISI